jgi:hypothetical protein
VSEFDKGIPKISIEDAIDLLSTIAENVSSAGNQGIFLWGPPGIGKSDLVRELASRTGREFIDIRLTTLDPVDLRGLPKINEKERITEWIAPEFLPRDNDKSGILFLDEINAAPPSVQAAAYQLILDRKLGGYRVPDDWVIIAAGNRLGDRSITYQIPTALANRFTHLEIIVDNDQWYNWAYKNEIDPYIISFIKYQPNLLHQFDQHSTDVVFPTPRSWAFASNLQKLRDQNIHLYLKGLNGTVGRGVAQQFIAFLKHRDDLEDPEVILSGGKFEYPTRPDQLYITMGALIHSITSDLTDEKLDYYFDFAKYYEGTEFADYSVLLIKELMQALSVRDEELNSQYSLQVLNHPKYKQWVETHKQLLM